ncbi:prion-like-(Q/N-rich) domain-bearing protein 25 [Chironomus tepperi]|uniref:prion-like-(Q/N-rich) domain-bearing protein 25 n=1 Tax=Chironomus tepperi TaxID=113505 RepID=UPI00391FAB1D
MKILFLFASFFYVVYGYADSFSECIGQPNGVRLPGQTCNQFILCDSQSGLTLTCRATEPHFDRCEQRCVDNPDVCDITSCDGDPPTSTTSTTIFTPPTVPAGCPIPCDNLPHTCTCRQQWRCINAVCQCDPNISCFLTRAQCMADSQCGGANGCPERCECIDDNTCICNKDTQCPFNNLQCNARCGCVDNCDCRQGDLRCFCHENCLCDESQSCPFPPRECQAACQCEQQCVCNGNMCMCDSGIDC